MCVELHTSAALPSSSSVCDVYAIGCGVFAVDCVEFAVGHVVSRPEPDFDSLFSDMCFALI